MERQRETETVRHTTALTSAAPCVTLITFYRFIKYDAGDGNDFVTGEIYYQTCSTGGLWDKCGRLTTSFWPSDPFISVLTGPFIGHVKK